MGVRKKNKSVSGKNPVIKSPGRSAKITKNEPVNDEINNSLALFKTTLDSSFDYIQVFKAVRDKGGKIIDFIWVLNNRKLIERQRLLTDQPHIAAGIDRVPGSLP